MMVKFGATSLVAAAALRLLVESYAATAKVGRMEGLPLLPLVEMRGLTAAPDESSVGHRWRVSDDPMRHVFRMAAWNALGWPILPALGPQWRPALFSISEEDARADGVTRGDLWDDSGKLSCLPAAAHGAARGRFSPRLERVEEEAAHLFEAENATSNELFGREVVADLPEAPWRYVGGKFPASLSLSSASADLPFALKNRFEVEPAGDRKSADIVLDTGWCHVIGEA